MKIIDALVTDPRRRGEYLNPQLVIDIDEDLHETGDPVLIDSWRIIPHGPFFAVDQYDGPGSDEWENGDLGLFNVTSHLKQKLVDVMVCTPTEEIDIAMGLDRARRLLRKFDQPWRYVLDDVAGQHGKLAWRLVEQSPTCVRCSLPADAEPYYRGTHLPLCVKHLGEHNKMIRKLRVNS